MKIISRLLVLGLAAALLSGCVFSVGGNRGSSGDSKWQQVERENRDAIARLSKGMYVEDVRLRMGTPDFLESFSRDGHAFQVFFYRTHRVKADGITTRDETRRRRWSSRTVSWLAGARRSGTTSPVGRWQPVPETGDQGQSER